MKPKKKNLKLLFFIIVITQTLHAQETTKKRGKSLPIPPPTEKGIKDQGVKSHTHQNGCCQYKMLYLGGSLNNPSANNNQRLYGNYSGITTGLTLDYSQTILRKPGFSIGFNFGGQYFVGNSDPFKNEIPPAYLIANQISSDVTSSGNSKSSGYFIGVGPQFNIHFANHFVFSPIFQVGYLGVTQSEFKATQTTLINGGPIPNYTKTYDLMTQTETKTSGLAFIPKARLTYMFSKTIGIWVESSYTVGPTSKNSTSEFAPQGEPSSQGIYSVAQMDAGTYTTISSDSKYKSVGFNFGVVFNLKPKSGLIILGPNGEILK